MNRLLPACAVFLTGSITSLAQIIHVPGDRSTIQTAIDHADHGDTVIVSEGIYFENIDFKGKAITLASHFLIDRDTAHISRTILDGSRGPEPDKGSVVSFRSGEDTTTVLCGFTIRGGTGSRIDSIHTLPGYVSSLYLAGGGVFIYGSGGKILHNKIEYNHLLADDSFRGIFGGGILATVFNNHTAIIRHNIIRNNSGKGKGGWGGGASLMNGRIIFEQNAVFDNTVRGQGLATGGGIFYENDSKSGTLEEVIIRGNMISGNRTNSMNQLAFGGGIYLTMGLKEKRVQLLGNLITNNYSNSYGGGISAWSTYARVANNVVANNRAIIDGDNMTLDGRDNEIEKSHNFTWSGEILIATVDTLIKLETSTTLSAAYLSGENDGAKIHNACFSIHPATGEITTGKKKGYITFHPDSISQTAFDPPSVIVDFQTLSQQELEPTLLQRNIPFKSFHVLELPRGTDYIKFKIASLSPFIQSRNQYLHYLEGVDPDTIITLDQTISYGQLEPGKYNFWATWSRSRDEWDPFGINIRVVVLPPWYRTTMALVGYLVMLVTAVLMIIKIRTWKLKREKVMLESLVAERTEELQKKNEQISEMEALKTRFFTDISHEIRTPLSLITGPLENLIRQDHDDPRTLKWLHMIRRNSNGLLQLINQLLDITRLDSGQMKLVIENLDLNRHLRQIVSEFTSMAERLHIRFLIEVSREPYVSMYDKAKLEKVVNNLLSNAFKFTPGGGIVTFRSKLLKGSKEGTANDLRIFVADTGPGIPEEEREKIFDRFYRSDAELDGHTGGTGIGLSLTRDLVKQMHGEIWVKSLLGTGSVFMITLPLGTFHLREEEYMFKPQVTQKQSPEFPKAHELIENLDEPATVEKNEVLVVEDNQDLRTFIRENLSDKYRLSESVDGNEGFAMATSHIPDLIISDVMMPGVDGVEMCRRLKNDERTSHIPVILLTARSTLDDKIRGLNTGADDYIYKPFSVDELEARIGNLLLQRENLKKKYSGMIGMDWDAMTVKTLDEQFLKKLTGTIASHMQDFEFNVGELQEHMAMSREHLYRKVKALTGESPSSLIRLMRLKRAATMIAQGERNITMVAYNTGFANLSYFARRFREYYGKTPSEYRGDLVK